MANILSHSRPAQFWILIIPTIVFFYIGLFITMQLWYPTGLPRNDWQAHLVNFSIIYLSWLIIFYANRLFDLESLRSAPLMLARLVGTFVLCIVAAVVYFYFQPDLLLTPRRFLLIHVLISGLGITAWYSFAQITIPHLWRSTIFAHDAMSNKEELEQLLKQHRFAGLKYGGVISDDAPAGSHRSIVVFPQRLHLEDASIGNLFNMRSQGMRFIEYHDFYETVTRTVHLSALTELWFINSIDYGSHRLFDILKRLVDIFLGLIAALLFLITFPIIALLIKLSSQGPVFFSQMRVGQGGQNFRLYKYRTMTENSSSNTWAHDGQQVTAIGKILRAARLDELPQSLNILKGDMSIVGPRPEQVHIVEQLREQIPYYDERHIVKPGLTGWAQLHVYASSVEETKRKLQYDLYYIKHRSLLFDAEIILKTVYNIITFSGQ